MQSKETEDYKNWLQTEQGQNLANGLDREKTLLVWHAWSNGYQCGITAEKKSIIQKLTEFVKSH